MSNAPSSQYVIVRHGPRTTRKWSGALRRMR
jgi:hypothetical protein